MKRIVTFLLALVIALGMLPGSLVNVYAATGDTSSSTTSKSTSTCKITTQPKNKTVSVGETAKFTVVASGKSLKYQWQYRTSSSGSWKSSGHTGNKTATLKIAAKSANNGYQYRCKITGSNGKSVYTDAATLKVKPAITAQPKSVAVAKGATAKVTVKAVGDGLTYQWYFKNKGVSRFTLSSTTGSTYSAVMNSDRNGRQVYCVVKDKYGNKVTTDVATLSMKQTAKIITQPKSVAAAKGATAKVTVKATGDGLTYQWYFKNKGVSKFTPSSTTGSTYSAVMNSDRNGRQVYCVVKDKYGNKVTSNTVTMTMRQTAKITTQPKSVAVAKGATAKVTVKATGDSLTYQWYFKNKGVSKFTLSSTTGSTYSAVMNSDRNGRQVYCVVKDKYGNKVTTNTVTLSIKTALKITTQPNSLLVARGNTAKITVKATGDGLTYQWYFKNKGASSYTLSSYTGSTYSATMDYERNGRKVYCVVTDKYGSSVKSNVASMHMKEAHDWVKEVTKQPTNTQTGKVTYSCVLCGESFTATIPKTSFDPSEYTDPYHVKTSENPENYVDFKISGSTLRVAGRIVKENLINVWIQCGNAEKILSVGSGELFSAELSLSGLAEDSYVTIFVHCTGDQGYWSYIYNTISVIPGGGSYRFDTPLVLQNNIEQMQQWVDPNDCLSNNISDDLVDLSNSIVGSEKNVYKKMYLLNKWVADNIYYDYDYYDGKSSTIYYTADDVYRTKRTVCEGYANLLRALLQAQGIPAIKVYTYSAGTLDESNYQTTDSNHAHVEAYLASEDRWVTMDPTWDSGNEYRDGEYIKGISSPLYFDMSVNMFAYTHKILTRDVKW